ncbi:MAG: histidine kinase dimerization/phospho-acceptor domain-containing protein [Pseudomonadota bacterium]
MFFDDRLSTVLRQEGTSEAAKRTQFRQLLDILGNRKFGPAGGRDRSLIAAAWLRMDALGRSIPAAERAAMIREPSWRFRSADLAAHLADFEPEVASAALNRAQLSAEDWPALIARLPLPARRYLRLREDLPLDAQALLDRLGVQGLGLPSPSAGGGEAAKSDEPGDAFELDIDAIIEEATSAPIDPVNQPEPPDPIETGRSEISALVERIALFKRNREASDTDALIDSERSPRLPLGEGEMLVHKRSTGFGFCADAAGRIEWAEAEVAPMVIGTRLVAPQVLGETGGLGPLERAYLQRQPLIQRRAHLAGAPAIDGEWSVDAEPRFTEEGHFTGYVGRFRRPDGDDPNGADGPSREADRIRQLLHELRTPVTAVQGYAEVIQQQLFGPAPHEYRALAATIAVDAARILAGFEELDRLSRMEMGAAAIEAGESDLAALVDRTATQLSQVLAPRMAGISVEIGADAPVCVSIAGDEAELLIWRIMATLGAGCSAGETLSALLFKEAGRARLICDLPRELLASEDIFSAEVKPSETAINAGVFGAGFALRLARAEARAAGGDLAQDKERVTLTLPLLKPLPQTASQEPPLTKS